MTDYYDDGDAGCLMRCKGSNSHKWLHLLAGIVLLLVVSTDAASQNVDLRELGKDDELKGAETKRRGDYWRLVRIETSAEGFGSPREAKDLPVDTKERKGVRWGYGKDRRITLDFVFKGVKEIVTRSSSVGTDLSLNVLVNATVSGTASSESTDSVNAVGMRCRFSITSASAQEQRGDARMYRISASTYERPEAPGMSTFVKQAQFECPRGNGDMRFRGNPEEDFVLNFVLDTWEIDPQAGQVGANGFHFYYKWQGGSEADNRPAGGADLKSVAGGPPDRDPSPGKTPAGALDGLAITKPAPVYPAIARAAGIAGVVTVQVTVDENGVVVNASAVSGPPLLRQAAVNAAKQASFKAGSTSRTGHLTYTFVVQ